MKSKQLHAILILWCCLALLPASWPAIVRAEDNDEIKTRLARMPRPWTQKVHRITMKEYETTLEYWAEKYAN